MRKSCQVRAACRPNTAGRITCLLSGGYDSAVAAYQMMKRGAHLSFIHFFTARARAPGNASLHVASGLARQLVRYQFHTKLYRVPFEEIQREIVRYAPEDFRVLLYRRMMVRIAEVLAKRDRALALVTGDSLGQVASQTLRNLAAVDAAATIPVFRPLIGTDKIDILATAKKIGTYDISSEPFHDCCPVFMPRSPALYAKPEELDEAESRLDLSALVTAGLLATTLERMRYAGGRVDATGAAPDRSRRCEELCRRVRGRFVSIAGASLPNEAVKLNCACASAWSFRIVSGVLRVAGADVALDLKRKLAVAGVIVYSFPEMVEIKRTWAARPCVFPTSRGS